MAIRFTIEGKGTFRSNISPEKLTIRRAIKWKNDAQRTGSKMPVQRQLEGYDQDVLTFDLILDGTGIFEGENNKDVTNQIKKINAVCYDPESEDHGPKLLNIKFGRVLFKGYLDTLNYELQLFDNLNKCIRAKVSFQVTANNNSKATVEASAFASPDMSHIKVFGISDAIPLFSNEVYNNPYYYIQLSKINSLTNFRKVKVGTNIMIPPLTNS
jgi:Contractile injection system tube protein